MTNDDAINGGASRDDRAARIEALEAELEEVRNEARQCQDRWLRERADLENLKKRVARERADTIKFGNENVLKDLLPIVDNLERALEHARSGGDGQPLADGVALITRALKDVLERHGVSRIEAKGARFDPAHHEAMNQIETTQHEPNTVVSEHQAGYRLNDRLLRPALVTVAKAPEGEAFSSTANLAKGKPRD